MTDVEVEEEVECPACVYRRAHGRSDGEPIHCKDCHRSWTGVEAQHCVRCHLTFTTIKSADDHPCGPGFDPAAEEGWREKRPGVWTSSAPMSQEQRTAFTSSRSRTKRAGAV